MRPAESFISQPIRSLQTMLRVIAQSDGESMALIPDGIYGPQTVQAVSHFQRQHGIPVTGVTDQPTWEAVVAAYEPALVEQASACPLQIILQPGEVLCKGSDNANLGLVQAMLQCLCDAYQSVGQPGNSGTLDDATADALSSFQGLCGLPMTGNVDRMTWKHLALQYPLAANSKQGK